MPIEIKMRHSLGFFTSLQTLGFPWSKLIKINLDQNLIEIGSSSSWDLQPSEEVTALDLKFGGVKLNIVVLKWKKIYFTVWANFGLVCLCCYIAILTA